MSKMKNKKLTREEALRRYRSTRDRKEKRLEENLHDKSVKHLK